jgi:glucosamine--fructose-6-phosphate aminotransferase (isomerizing)
MSIMYREIIEQPDAVAAALEGSASAATALAAAVVKADVRSVVIAARGTSDNAATYAKYLIETTLGIPCALAAPSVITLYGVELRVKDALVLGISQSGQGSDIVEVLSSARSSGAITACVTNNPESPLAGACDHVLLCNAGEEMAVAATKTYTTSLAAVAQLVAYWSGCAQLASDLASAPALMREALTAEEAIVRNIARYRYMTECSVLARGLNQCTALEASLKLTETCYVGAKPWSAADFMHGPIAVVEDGFPCFLFAPDGKALPAMAQLTGVLDLRRAEMVIASACENLLQRATAPIPMPAGVPEAISPLVYILAGQLLACRLSEVRGVNPDAPRGLSKVTVTR